MLELLVFFFLKETLILRPFKLSVAFPRSQRFTCLSIFAMTRSKKRLLTVAPSRLLARGFQPQRGARA